MEATTQTDSNKTLQKTETHTRTAEEPSIFCPVRLTESPTMPHDSVAEIEKKLHEFLTVVNEESTQLGRFLADENKIVNEVCLSLTTVLRKLRVSFSIHPLELPIRRGVKKAILNRDGQLVLTYDKGESRSAFLADYPPEVIMSVLWVIIPELARTIVVYRKRLSARISLFEKLKKELKTVADAIETEGAKEEQRGLRNGWC